LKLVICSSVQRAMCPLTLASCGYPRRAVTPPLVNGLSQTASDDEADAVSRVASIDLIDTVATVRLELDNWTGGRYTDLFTLLKVDGEWKIMNKVFHLHQ